MKKRIVSIDYGLSRIGVAISDERKIIAMPLQTVQAHKNTSVTIEAILKVLSPYAIEKIIVGLPLKLNGQKSFMSDETTHFLNLLQEKVSCPVVSFDERLTTVQAERALKEGNMNRKKRSRVIDTVAATLLLQNFLDFSTKDNLDRDIF